MISEHKFYPYVLGGADRLSDKEGSRYFKANPETCFTCREERSIHSIMGRDVAPFYEDVEGGRMRHYV